MNPRVTFSGVDNMPKEKAPMTDHEVMTQIRELTEAENNEEALARVQSALDGEVPQEWDGKTERRQTAGQGQQ
jgi:hypothetical protein